MLERLIVSDELPDSPNQKAKKVARGKLLHLVPFFSFCIDLLNQVLKDKEELKYAEVVLILFLLFILSVLSEPIFDLLSAKKIRFAQEAFGESINV